MITIERNNKEPMYLQIEKHFVERIKSGELLPNTKIPEAVEFGQKLGVSHLTVRQAYKRLAQRGYIYGIRGKGTFVNNSAVKTACGLAVSLEYFRNKDGSSLYAATADWLVSLSEKSGYQFKLVILTTPYKEQLRGVLYEQDRKQLLDPTLFGIFLSGVCLPADIREELRAKRIKMISIPESDSESDLSVFGSEKAQIVIAAKYMQSRGRRNPVVLYNESTPGGDMKRRQMLMSFLDEEGLSLPSSSFVGVSEPSESAGRYASEHLLKLVPKIDGIISLDDGLTKGICWTLAKAGVSVPGDILLVSHSNKDITPSFILPVARVSWDICHMLEVAFDNMNKLVNNEKIAEKMIEIVPTFTPENIPNDSGVELYLSH